MLGERLPDSTEVLRHCDVYRNEQVAESKSAKNAPENRRFRSRSVPCVEEDESVCSS